MTNGGKKGVSLDNSLVSKAVDALLKHHATRSAKDLLGSENAIHLQIGLVVAPKDPSSRHYNIELPHAVYKDISDAEVCLFVKNDETKRQIKELKEQFSDLLKPVVKIMTLDSLRSKHGEYGQRRSLMKRYTQFMVDDRILPMMPAALGRDFIKKTRLPLPIKVTRTKSLPRAIQRALKSTYYTVKGGTCVNVRVAATSMSGKDICENIIAASRDLHLASNSIQSLCIKLPESAALPLYNQSPEQLYDVIEMARQEEEKVEEERKAAVKEKQEAIKSPLLKALKKQKQLETGETTVESKESKKVIKSKEQKKGGNSEEVVTGSLADTSEQETVSQSKKSKPEKGEKELSANSRSKKKDTDKSKNPKVSKKKGESAKRSGGKEVEDSTTSKKDKEAEMSSNDKERKEDKMDTDQVSESGKKRKKTMNEESPSAAKKTKAIEENDETAKFIRAKKYSGSKSGYVYKKGPEGLGYYVDIKPEVNKAALDALRRSLGSSNSKKSRSSSQKRGSSKSRSKSRGSSNDSKRRR